jgi:hypothetical protein
VSLDTQKTSGYERLVSHLPAEARLKLARAALAGLSEEEHNQIVAEELGRLEPGRQPFEIFKQLARIGVLPTLEFAAVKPNEEEDSFDIALKLRKSHGGNRDWWENQWHVPGTVLTADAEYPAPENETDLSTFRNSLISAEFGDAIELTGEPITLPIVLREGPRGKEVTVRQMAPVRLVPGAELPDTIRFFDARNVLANPPDGGLVGSHDRLIRTVAEFYQRNYQA